MKPLTRAEAWHLIARARNVPVSTDHLEADILNGDSILGDGNRWIMRMRTAERVPVPPNRR